jgi:hypothetical protein
MLLEYNSSSPNEHGQHIERKRQIISEKKRVPSGAMPKVISLKTIVVASRENVSCSLGDEAAILDMRSGQYYGLDPIGARIWKLLDQPKSVEELRAAILEEYEVEPAKCESDLLSLLETLRTQGLVKTCDV